MPPQIIFLTHLVLGYAACLLCFSAYILPRLRSIPRVDAYRAIATLHSFRFFGLVFLLPGFVGPGLPAAFARPAAFGDLATGVLALITLLAFRSRPLFHAGFVAFNVIGLADLLLAYYHAIRLGLPEHAGQLGAAYVIPIVYVPLLAITHCLALYWLVQPQSGTASLSVASLKEKTNA